MFVMIIDSTFATDHTLIELTPELSFFFKVFFTSNCYFLFLLRIEFEIIGQLELILVYWTFDFLILRLILNWLQTGEAYLIVAEFKELL